MTDVRKLLDEATPLPWGSNAPDGGLIVYVWPNGRWGEPIGTALLPSDAALIVHAVNHLPDYEAAVDALERLAVYAEANTPQGPTPLVIAEARAVLRRLRGEG